MSLFRELFDDFTAEALLYVERLNVTEVVFMRYLTRGMQLFQRKTAYVETSVRLQPAPPPPTQPVPTFVGPVYQVPADMLYPIAVLWTPDPTGAGLIRCVFQSYTQFIYNVERAPAGYLETPIDYSVYTATGVRWPQHPRALPICTIYRRMLMIYPPPGQNDVVIMDYVPDIHAFSAGSPQWAAWFPLDTNFMNLFNTARPNPTLEPFERAFVAYALATFIRSNGNANYMVFEREFEREVQEAILTKPTLYREGLRDYAFAPWV